MTLHTFTALVLLMPSLSGDDIDRARRVCAAHGVDVVTVTGLPVGWAAVYDLGANRIEMNLDSGHWGRATARSAYLHATGVYSSPHPDHVIRHEIGHARFCTRAGIARVVLLEGLEIGLPRDRIARIVSSTAARNPLEFVAEVYAGLWAGRVYPEDVMRCYRDLWKYTD